jgi:hypothetical protein
VPEQLDVCRIEKHLLERARTKPRITTAVIHPCSHSALLAAIEAACEGLIEPVLVGPQSKITRDRDGRGAGHFYLPIG